MQVYLDILGWAYDIEVTFFEEDYSDAEFLVLNIENTDGLANFEDIIDSKALRGQVLVEVENIIKEEENEYV